MEKPDIERHGKPWGSEEWYALNRRCTVKILHVREGQALSLQSHRKRDEIWVALDEGLEVEIDGKMFKPRKGEALFIPMGSKHRLSGKGGGGRVLEVSLGDFDPDDIVRYKDEYGRA